MKEIPYIIAFLLCGAICALIYNKFKIDIYSLIIILVIVGALINSIRDFIGFSKYDVCFAEVLESEDIEEIRYDSVNTYNLKIMFKSPQENYVFSINYDSEKKPIVGQRIKILVPKDFNGNVDRIKMWKDERNIFIIILLLCLTVFLIYINFLLGGILVP
jgi:hypothetical protein